MNTPDIAQDPEARAALAAMQRAAELARKIAIQTDTGIVIQKDGKLIRLSAQALRLMTASGEERDS